LEFSVKVTRVSVEQALEFADSEQLWGEVSRRWGNRVVVLLDEDIEDGMATRLRCISDASHAHRVGMLQVALDMERSGCGFDASDD
jgi:PHP family Zn ribbon phosphoesterase